MGVPTQGEMAVICHVVKNPVIQKYQNLLENREKNYEY